MVSIEEYPFSFMNTPASLQVLASVEIALTYWRRKLANTSCNDALKILDSKEKPRCKEVLDVRVPCRIRAQIDENIISIGKQLSEWIYFHSDRDLCENSTEAFFSCSKHIVADFSGSIGYKATAINILNSGEFNDAVNNYKISCTFCLEDQVKRFWPAVANDSRINVISRYEYDNFNSSYWSGIMKVGNSITSTEMVKLRMIKVEAMLEAVLFRRGDGPALEYFCKMLPDDVRISKIISWLKSGCDRAVLRSLSLHTLDRVQAEKVFKQRASSIFRIFMYNNYFQFAHQLWTLMGHLVVENESQFSEVVFRLWKMAFNPNSDGRNFTRRDQINDLLFEIWSNASDELKAHVSDTFWRDGSILDFSRYSRPIPFHYVKPNFPWSGFASYYGHDMTFMLEMMSKLSDVRKEQLWRKYWRELALRSKPLYLEKFMRMCLPNDDKIQFFKNQLAEFDDLFKSLIGEGFYSDLKDYVMFCSKDTIQCQQLGKKVLGSNICLISFHDDDRFAKFEWFVGEIFVNVELEEFKRQMISSAECVKKLLAARQAGEISSNDFSRIIRRFVNNEEELPLVKRKLFEHRCEHLTETCFKVDEWHEFLVWCTADHEEISTFKRSLDVDVIFLKRLKGYLDGECYVEGLDFLDNFLNWYFGSEEDVKNFKSEKVKNDKQIEDVLRVELENQVIVRVANDSKYTLLKWLFDNNEENVAEFCKRCNCSLRRAYIRIGAGHYPRFNLM